MDSAKKILDSGIIEEYLIGGLSEEARQQVEQYIEQYPEVKAHFNMLQETLWKMADDMAIPPPPSVKSKIMAELENNISANSTPSGMDLSRFLPWVIAIAISAFAMNAYNTADEKIIKLEEEKAQLIKDCEQGKQQYIASLEQFNLLQNAETQVSILENKNKSFKAIAYVNEGKLMMDLKSRPKLPEGKCLQLWGDKDGEMISIAVLAQNNNYMESSLVLDPAFSSINVTIEDLGPDGKGSDHATVANLVASAIL